MEAAQEQDAVALRLSSDTYLHAADRRSEERWAYRNGHETRRITSASWVKQTLRVPRGRIVEGDGTTREFQNEVVPRYARRTRQ